MEGRESSQGKTKRFFLKLYMVNSVAPHFDRLHGEELGLYRL